MEVLEYLFLYAISYIFLVVGCVFILMVLGGRLCDSFIDGVKKCRWGRNNNTAPVIRNVHCPCYYPVPLHKQLADMEWEERPYPAIARTGLTFEEACDAFADMRTHVQTSMLDRYERGHWTPSQFSITAQDIGDVRPLINRNKIRIRMPSTPRIYKNY